MNSKILILAFVACYQVAVAQQQGLFPNPLGTAVPPFLGGFNNNWARPYYTAAAEGWRTYFEQMQQARNQLYQTLTNPNNNHAQGGGELKPPAAPAPPAVHTHETHETVTPTRPALAQNEHNAIQDAITHAVSQVNAARPPTNVGLPGVASGTLTSSVSSGTRPITSAVTSGTRPITSTVPQVGAAIVPQVGSQLVPNVGSWVGK